MSVKAEGARETKKDFEGGEKDKKVAKQGTGQARPRETVPGRRVYSGVALSMYHKKKKEFRNFRVEKLYTVLLQSAISPRQ